MSDVSEGDRVTIHPQNQPLLDHLEGRLGTVRKVWEHRQLVPRIPMIVRIDGPDNVMKVETMINIDMDEGGPIILREGDGWYRPASASAR